MYRVGWRAFSVVNTIGIGHVGFVVWGIQVFAIPAARKENLSAQATIGDISIKNYDRGGEVGAYSGQFMLGNALVSGPPPPRHE